jgi:hypothetical protein
MFQTLIQEIRMNNKKNWKVKNNLILNSKYFNIKNNYNYKSSYNTC